eukprot:595569-Prorocentrum_minimum.AAC.1
MTLDDTYLTRRGFFSSGPLLGRLEWTSSSARIFSNALSPKHYPWMTHHVVQKVPIVPAAGCAPPNNDNHI